MIYSDKINQAIGKRNSLIEQKGELQTAYDTEVVRSKNLELAQAFIQKIASDTQSQLKYHIESIVQMALDAVFPDRYKYNVAFEMKRGRTEARMFLMEGENEIDPMSACGGGVVDIIALALRITVYTLAQTRNTIILDEPMRFVSKDLQPQATEIIKQLSKKLGIQFIIVTHSTDIVEQADKVFTATIKDGVSNVV